MLCSLRDNLNARPLMLLCVLLLLLFGHQLVKATPAHDTLEEAAGLPQQPSTRKRLNTVAAEAEAVQKVALDDVDAQDGDEEDLDQPAEQRRASREAPVQQGPGGRSGDDPRQRRGAGKVESDGQEDDPVAGPRGHVGGDGDVADAQVLAGGGVHLDEAGPDLVPAPQRRDKGHGVVEAAGADVHGVERDVAHRGVGGLALGEAVVVPEVVAHLARVVAVHVRRDSVLARLIVNVGRHGVAAKSPWRRRWLISGGGQDGLNGELVLALLKYVAVEGMSEVGAWSGVTGARQLTGQR